MSTIRFTAGPLGLLAGIDDLRFAAETVNVDDVGELLPEEETAGKVPEGWRMARVKVLGAYVPRPDDADDEGFVIRFAPVHPAQYELDPVVELADPPTPGA